MNIDIDKIKFAALCSKMVYNPVKPLVELQNPEYYYDENDEVRAMFGFNPQYGQVLAFKGTDSIKDFFVDAQIEMVPFYKHPMVLCHKGFRNNFMSIFEPIWEKIYKIPFLLITGHSLGGALASILGTFPHLYMPSRITFGTPKTMNDIMANGYNSLGAETIRVVHANDIVPNLIVPGAVHTKGELHIDDYGNVLNPSDWKWWKKLFVEEKRIIDDLDGKALSDHHMDNYISALTNLRSKRALL